ncbi:MAG TPA: DUF4397 domain-containing protein [Gemmatimonadaceae bacterium]|nr:DUF4397 domain-containing protein [Gemmatimonadaceae bacterium]
MHFRFITLLAAATMLAACGDKADIPSGVDPNQPFGRFRFVNAVADSAAAANRVNVRVDGVPLGVSLAYGAAAPATSYLIAYQGARNFLVQQTADTAAHVLDEDVTITADTTQTVYATIEGGSVTTFVTLDDLTLPGADSVKIRLVNLAPSAGNVDVYVTAVGADISTMAPTVADMAPSSASEYLRLKRGTWQVRFTTAGTKTVVRSVNVAPPSGSAPYIRTVVVLDPVPPATALTSAVLTDR